MEDVNKPWGKCLVEVDSCDFPERRQGKAVVIQGMWKSTLETESGLN